MLLQLCDTLPFLKYHIWGFFYYCYVDVERKFHNEHVAEFFSQIFEEIEFVKEFFQKYSEDRSEFDQAFIINHSGPQLIKDVYSSFLSERIFPILKESALMNFFLEQEEDSLKVAVNIVESLKSLQEDLPVTEV